MSERPPIIDFDYTVFEKRLSRLESEATALETRLKELRLEAIHVRHHIQQTSANARTKRNRMVSRFTLERKGLLHWLFRRFHRRDRKSSIK